MKKVLVLEDEASIRGFIVINLRMKIFLIQPFLIDPVLQTVRIIGLCQFFSHTVLCSFLQMKKTFTVSSTAKGEQTRYHLCLSACDIHTRHLNRL